MDNKVKVYAQEIGHPQPATLAKEILFRDS
jgi:hypothetical protein